jgi:hypothetical protein
MVAKNRDVNASIASHLQNGLPEIALDFLSIDG